MVYWKKKLKYFFKYKDTMARIKTKKPIDFRGCKVLQQIPQI